MLGRDERLPLDTWNQSRLRENVLGNQFSAFDSPKIILKEIQSCAQQEEQRPVPQAIGTGTLFARDDTQNKDTIPMPTFAGRPSTMRSLIPVEFPHNSINCWTAKTVRFGSAFRQIP